MKNIKFNLLGVFAIATMLFFAGCEDLCKDVDCGDNGSCVEGDCVCEAGYEGTSCETMVNAKFAGTYTLDESCTVSGTDTYTVTVTSSTTSPTTITLNNLYAAGIPVTGTVSTSNSTQFDIDNQTFGNGTIEGNGTIDEGTSTITFTYTVSVGGTSETCSGDMVAQ